METDVEMILFLLTGSYKYGNECRNNIVSVNNFKEAYKNLYLSKLRL
jgi:hypothetical protein